MSAFNKLVFLKPSWEKNEEGGYIGGGLIIYCENEEHLEKILLDFIYSGDNKANYPNCILVKYKPTYDADIAYYLKNINAEQSRSDCIDNYWFVDNITPAILPDEEFGVVFCEIHEG